MAWRIKAKYYEACNCDFGCPCNMSGFPTTGSCEGVVAFQVTEGERNGVDLTGVKVVGAVKWPGAIHEGNGTESAWIDATPEQVEALGPILTAEDPGLPWEIIAATVTTVHGPYMEKIEIVDNGSDSTIRVGDAVDVQMASFVNPVNGEKHEAHMVLPGGFIFTDGHICTTSVNEIDVDGVTYDHKGNNAYYSEVEWSSDNRLAPVG